MVSTIGDHIQSSIQKQNYYYYQSSYLGSKPVENFRLETCIAHFCLCVLVLSSRLLAPITEIVESALCPARTDAKYLKVHGCIILFIETKVNLHESCSTRGHAVSRAAPSTVILSLGSPRSSFRLRARSSWTQLASRGSLAQSFGTSPFTLRP